MSVIVDCLRSEHVVGKDKFPLFAGFMKAGDLARVAVAPQFQLTTAHEVIAGNVSSNPVREWQRPPDPGRVDEITRTFKQVSEIMPNAVLLAAPDSSLVELKHQGVGRLWSLKVEESAASTPLWILDGQHRIAGLSAALPVTEVPFVLLASHDASALYQESTFAKIFAQVTTTAEGLHPLHNEWLTFAFSLGKYDASRPLDGTRNALQHDAMEATVHLCHERYLNVAKTKANPFFDRVAFNPRSYKRSAASPAVGPTAGGFQMDATTFQKFFYNSYYGATSMPAGRLEPKVVGREVARAYEALVECHDASSRASSILLTPAGTAGALGHKAMQEGFLHGVLRYLAMRGIPKDWKDELDSRFFGDTDWSSGAWASGSRSGSEGTINKRLAKSVFESLLGGTAGDLFLPTAVVPATLDLNDYFSGTVGFGVEIQGRRQNADGRKLQFSGKTDPMATLESGKPKTRLSIGSLRMLAIGKVTPNVVAVTVADVARPFEREWKWPQLKAGQALGPEHLHGSPVTLRFEFTFYGGEVRDAQLSLTYS